MKARALTLTELLVALAVITLLMAILLPVLVRMRYRSYRAACANNLSQIAKAMFMYANDYEDQFPRAGGPNSTWGTTPNWQAHDQFTAYNLQPDDSGGQATISASLYLLVKYEQVTTKSFICKADSGTTEFTLRKYDLRDKELIHLWDFGLNPSKHCSYSYHMPYGDYAVTTSSRPGMAVAADRNPFIDSPGTKAVSVSDFNPAGTKKQQKIGNSPSHKKDGQNVLFMDSHVGFEKVCFCGINYDNIYTYWDGPDIRRGAPPKLDSQPADKLDSLLVHDPPLHTGQ